MKVEVDAVDLKELQADSRGRVCLGPEYNDERVTVAVVEVAGDG